MGVFVGHSVDPLFPVGNLEGAADGNGVGVFDGTPVGNFVAKVGNFVGPRVGRVVGQRLDGYEGGDFVPPGSVVGLAVGISVDGTAVGAADRTATSSTENASCGTTLRPIPANVPAGYISPRAPAKLR